MEHQKGTIIQIVKVKTELSEAEILNNAKEREPQFKAIAGLVQKYYIKLENNGEYGGVYIWDSMESLEHFRTTELAKSIAQAYKAIEPPTIEVHQIMMQLRD